MSRDTLPEPDPDVPEFSMKLRIPESKSVKKDIEKLRRRVHEWLIARELGCDTAFYTREEWEARKEPYLAQSELVLVFEGELYRVINDGHPENVQLYEELQQLVRRLGYFFELGHAWNMGFYPLPAKSFHHIFASILSSHQYGARGVAPTHRRWPRAAYRQAEIAYGLEAGKSPIATMPKSWQERLALERHAAT